MKKRTAIVLGGVLIVGVAAAAFVMLPHSTHPGAAEAATDPRLEPPIVKLAKAMPVTGSDRSFTGSIGAKVQSALGFRVPGKIIERLVDVGQQVRKGQPLMRIDDTDLRLALAAKRNAIAAAQAAVDQTSADEKRFAALLKDGWLTRQRYEQAKAALDTAMAQRAAAQADAQVADNEAAYAVLLADADGIVVETLGEPGQVVAAGQTVVRIAQAGPREAVVALPETIRPELGSVAQVSLYGDGGQLYVAHLRQLSNAADAQTRTYEARYVLDGPAASAPLGATVTLKIASLETRPEVQVPLGALLDDGIETGVWVLDRDTSSVHFQPVQLVRLTSETAVIAGLNSGVAVVSLGAHLLQEGAQVRPAPESKGN